MNPHWTDGVSPGQLFRTLRTMKQETVNPWSLQVALHVSNRIRDVEHGELTDIQWTHVEPLFKKFYARTETRGRPAADRRATLNGILWKLTHGRPWVDLPERFPNAKTCHRHFGIWFRCGLLGQVLWELFDDHRRFMDAARLSIRRPPSRQRSRDADEPNKLDWRPPEGKNIPSY